jgi:hypothetical protein
MIVVIHDNGMFVFRPKARRRFAFTGIVGASPRPMQVVPVVALEAAPATKLLPQELRGTKPLRPEGSASHAPTPTLVMAMWEQAKFLPL